MNVLQQFACVDFRISFIQHEEFLALFFKTTLVNLLFFSVYRLKF